MGLEVEIDQVFKDDMTDPVTYTAYGQSGVAISIIFSGGSTEVREYPDGRRTIETAHIWCKPADVASPDKRDTFTIGGTTWQVDDERITGADNAGVLHIPLIRSTRKEISGPDFRRTL